MAATPTPTPCDACRERRLHTADEWTAYHRFAGHGYAAGVGWTDAGLVPAAGERADRPAAAPAKGGEVSKR